MRFYGLLFGKKAEADAMFASVERSYKDLQELVKPISFAPSVMCDLKTRNIMHARLPHIFLSNWKKLKCFVVEYFLNLPLVLEEQNTGVFIPTPSSK